MGEIFFINCCGVKNLVESSMYAHIPNPTQEVDDYTKSVPFGSKVQTGRYTPNMFTKKDNVDAYPIRTYVDIEWIRRGQKRSLKQIL